MRSIVLGAFLSGLISLGFVTEGMANNSPIRVDSPKNYQVKKGDTLWEISSRFLRSPWMWPEIWHANPQIHNPHLIFPGDVVSLVYIDGKPRLTIARRGESGRTIKLSPRVRTLPGDSAIPAVPLSTINSFLSLNRIFDTLQDIESAPYIFASRQERIISGAGDKVYARGRVDAVSGNMSIYRPGAAVTDPESGELLGVIGHDVADSSVMNVTDGVASLRITKSRREVLPGDRVLPEADFSQLTTFHPSAPDAPIDGKILAVLGGVKKIGKYSSVMINKGQREGLKQGDVLIIRKNIAVKDQITGEMVTLPPERAGMLMIYRPFEKLSYGIVLTALEEISVGDQLKNP